MAEVEFGDSELFEQLEDDEQKPVHIRFNELDDSSNEAEGLRERVRHCEATIEELQAENQELRRKLNILTRPSGLGMTDSKFDGPLLQILFMNSVISKQYHQDIEDFVTDLVNKYEQQQTSELERTSFNVKPQPSSIMLEEDNKSKAITTMKKIKEAFSVVGSVLYFTNFCLDKLGQPILNENPQLTEGWEVPKYQQVFTQIVSLEGQELTVKAKRPKAHCFNCGSEEHQLRDCPVPRDGARISGKRKAFMDACGEAGNQNYQQRYHAEEVEERFARFKPGIISDELQDALGVSENHLPPFVYRMRQLGYPPGWLKEAELENSGLSLYDGKDASDGEIEDGESSQKAICVSYDLSKLVNYPGFNVSAPRGTADDWRLFNSIPMQSFHQKDVFANYLSSTYPTQSPSSYKRTSTSQSSPSEIKKQKMGGSTSASPVDMDVDSDMEGPHTSQSCGGFLFQPPLPPGSPFIGTPPPLPQGTPPATPPNFTPHPPPTPTPPPLPKGTPPLTPSAGSPTAYDRASLVSQPKVADMDDDTLTIEELEEQQRLIWAALEHSESTNSDSDVPADTPVTVNSVASSPGRNNLDNIPDGRPPSEETTAVKLEAPGVCIQVSKTEPPKPSPTIEDFLLCIMDEETSNPDSKLTAENRSDAITSDENGQNGEPVEKAAEGESSTKVIVPDMSKFAVGITPFEYDNMAESTGLYLRLREVLKNSPRNQQKCKNQP